MLHVIAVRLTKEAVMSDKVSTTSTPQVSPSNDGRAESSATGSGKAARKTPGRTSVGKGGDCSNLPQVRPLAGGAACSSGIAWSGCYAAKITNAASG